MREAGKEMHRAERKEREKEQLMLKSQQYQPVSLSCIGSIGGGGGGGLEVQWWCVWGVRGERAVKTKFSFRALV